MISYAILSHLHQVLFLHIYLLKLALLLTSFFKINKFIYLIHFILFISGYIIDLKFIIVSLCGGSYQPLLMGRNMLPFVGGLLTSFSSSAFSFLTHLKERRGMYVGGDRGIRDTYIHFFSKPKREFYWDMNISILM